MLLTKSQMPRKVVATILALTCGGQIWLVISGCQRRNFRNNFSTSSKKESPLIASELIRLSSPSNSIETPSTSTAKTIEPPPGRKIFNSTILTGEDNRHMQRLSRLEATLAGMRDFLVRHVGASECMTNRSQECATFVRVEDYLRVMEENIKVMKETDQTIRRSVTKMRKLHSFFQESIDRLQNPMDCKLAPKLLCMLDNPHGFASGIHDVLWCFVAALQMNRTVILNSTLWHYTPETAGWSMTFKPVTGPSCNVTDSENITSGYPGCDYSAQSRSKILDMPSSIMEALAANHGEPYSWLYGQIIGYILRLQNSTRQKIEDFKKTGYKHPIVAMHIRRTDKILEGAYSEVTDYMQYAEDFYSLLELTEAAVQRRVFVATDDPSVIKEINTRFPSYIVISNERSANEAFDMDARMTGSALTNIIVDIHLLAEADKLICAQSSGFCRVAYELMQAQHAEVGLDATRKAVSVDMEYYYAFVPFPPRRTLYSNERVFDNELQWTAPGDLVERDDDWAPGLEAMEKIPDGFHSGRFVVTSVNSSKVVFPRFKTEQTYRIAHYEAVNVNRITL